MVFTPRSRVYVILIPVIFLLVVTYPYFRSFSRPNVASPLFDPSYHKRPSRPPPPSPQDSYDGPLRHHAGDADHVHKIPVLDTQLNQPHREPQAPPPAAAAPEDLNYPDNPDSDDSGQTPANSPYNTNVVPSGLAPTVAAPDAAQVTPQVPPSAASTPASQSESQSSEAAATGPKPFPTAFGNHPIDHLVQVGLTRLEELKKKEAHTLKDAAAAYRKARKRHPPPGFDKWYEFAKKKDALVIEELFDPIYQDTEPFWGRDPGSLRYEPNTWSNVITIRKGKVDFHNNQGNVDWGEKWIDMLKPIEKSLPDVDLSFNTYDEPRVIVPWKQINKYMEEASRHMNLNSPDRLVLEYQTLDPLSQEDLPEDKEHEWQDWHNMTYWQLARLACHPDSVAYKSDHDTNITLPPDFPHGYAEESHQGYVANYTFSRNACLNPHLRNLHGNFIMPRFASVNTTLFPMIAGSKHEGISNEIRVPAAKYWFSGKLFGGEDDFSTVDDDGPKGSSDFIQTVAWSTKDSKVFWRGAATGGLHDQTNWRHFQRHRFVSMLNSTEVSMTERKLENLTSLSGEDLLTSEPPLPHNFPVPNPRLYPLTALSSNPTKLGEWLAPLTDAAFTHMMCSPQKLNMIGRGRHCGYTDDFYTFSEMVPLSEAYNHKFLPDIDGNGYSGRYRAFLRSGSLPIKASVHSEWHDSRLIPWVHFVPMDNTYADFYGILEYFAGNPEAKGEGGRTSWFSEWLGWAGGGHDGGGRHGHVVTGGGHDHIAQAIAENGREWVQKVLRKEDMVVYMYRLVLEWARITNDGRDDMGWAEDLRKGGGGVGGGGDEGSTHTKPSKDDNARPDTKSTRRQQR